MARDDEDTSYGDLRDERTSMRERWEKATLEGSQPACL